MINSGVLSKQYEKLVRLPFYDIDEYGYESLSNNGIGSVYFGFELEYYVHGMNDKKSDKKCEVAERIYEKLFDSGLMYFCKSTLDGTCTGEVVMAPLSEKYIFSEEGESKFQKVLDIIKSEHGNVTQKTGGHIHISRTLDNNKASNMYRFAVENKDFFQRISGRKKVSKWSQFKIYRFRNHSDAINRDNKNTIEYRFWSGSLDFFELKKRAMFCYNMQKLFSSEPKVTKKIFKNYFLDLNIYRDEVQEYF